MFVNIKKKHKGWRLKHERLRIGLSNVEGNQLITVLACGLAWMKEQKRDVSFGEKFMDKLVDTWCKIDPRSTY